MVPEIIHTARAVLRPYRSADLDDVLAYAGDPEWRRFMMGLPDPYTRADAEAFLAHVAAVDRELHPNWAIEVEGRVVGGVSFHFVHEHRVAELGYSLAPRLWGRGLVLEVTRAAIDLAFTAYPQLVRIRARADTRNVRSLRVMEKLGMQREAHLRSDRLYRGQLYDEIVCGLLRHEWRA